jgi:hypothetical protein
VQPDGTFTLPNVWPGEYQVEAQIIGESVTSVQFGDREVLHRQIDFDGTDTPFRVKAASSAQLATVSGSVGGAAGQPIAGATVVLVRSGTAYVREPFASQITTSQNGVFTIRVPTPGLYHVYVVEDPAEADYFMANAAFLRSQEKLFAPVTVAPGDNPPLKLVLH